VRIEASKAAAAKKMNERSCRIGSTIKNTSLNHKQNPEKGKEKGNYES
jgi:hypothetical protein